MALTLKEFRAALARKGVSWHPIDTPNASEVNGYFERMTPDGTLLRAAFNLYDKDAPVGEHLERYVCRQLFPDDDAAN